jgi:hypothetical protein
MADAKDDYSKAVNIRKEEATRDSIIADLIVPRY